MNPKPKPEGLPDQPVDPTAVVYSEVKKEKLAPKSEESEQPPQTKSCEYVYPTFIAVIMSVCFSEYYDTSNEYVYK